MRVCCVWGAHYCVQVQLLPDVCDFFFQLSLYFSFAILFLLLSYLDLVPFTWSIEISFHLKLHSDPQ